MGLKNFWKSFWKKPKSDNPGTISHLSAAGRTQPTGQRQNSPPVAEHDTRLNVQQDPRTPRVSDSRSGERRHGDTHRNSPRVPAGIHHLSPAEAAARERHETNPFLVKAGGQLLSPKIRCDVIVVYNEQEFRDLEKYSLDWMDNSQFYIISSSAIKCIYAHGVAHTKKLYRKSGRCRLLKDPDDSEFASRILEDERQWSEVIPRLVTSFVHEYPYEKFHLEICWEYSDISLDKVGDEPFAETVRRAIRDKLKQNWENKDYIPRKDLDEIFTENTVKCLVEEDTSLTNMDDEKQRFVDFIQLEASRLFALCVFVELPLACLYHLMGKNINDNSLPLSPHDCPKDMYASRFFHLTTMQPIFNAWQFVVKRGRPEHRRIPDNFVVPLYFHKESDHLGEGGFGKVYRVKINSDHHFFSPDRNKTFALKIFKDSASKSEFENEHRTLEHLADVQHPHITPHLASWEQSERFYMLFPCADTNFGTFLKLRPHPELTNEFVRWLVNQLTGLADGVRKIHHLGPPNIGPDPGSLHPDVRSRTKGSRAGFHHDIKPQNILAFAKDDVRGREAKVTELTLKISDFGAARINVILSRSGPNKQPFSPHISGLSRGDPVYSAPDSALGNNIGRPYDIWSLGCVFLEVLLWTFGLDGADRTSFEWERLRDENSQSETNAFWCKDKSGEIRLKKAVVDRLRQLKRHCDGRGIFEHLVQYTAWMLTLTPKERVDASQVFNALDAIKEQLNRDLITPNIYRQDVLRRFEFAAPPTLYDGSTSKMSIDERLIRPQSTHLRVDSHAKPRRSSSPDQWPSITPHDGVANGQLTPDRGRLSPVTSQTQAGPNGHPRSPSISVSIHDDPSTSRLVHDASETNKREPFPPVGGVHPPVGGHQYSIDHGDLFGPFRPRSGSSDSRRTRSSDF